DRSQGRRAVHKMVPRDVHVTDTVRRATTIRELHERGRPAAGRQPDGGLRSELAQAAPDQEALRPGECVSSESEHYVSRGRACFPQVSTLRGQASEASNAQQPCPFLFTPV